jgi:LPXTG-motif cell wall-anchored protein
MIPAVIVYVAGADAIHQGFSTGRVPWNIVALIAGVVALLAVLSFALKRKTKKLH